MSFSNIDINLNLKIRDWLGDLSHQNKNVVSNLSKALAICWQIWNDRNGSIFMNEKPLYTRSFLQAMAMVNDYFKDNWKCPMSSYVKINFDGSVSNSLAARGFVIRNWNSKTILAGAMNMGFSTINIAEALALHEALIWARRRSMTHVLMKGDSKLIIDVVRGAYEVSWNLRSIIEDIRWHVFKEENFVTDTMASVGLKTDNFCIWDACLPVEANLALLFDCNGSDYVRGFSL
ncbi:hypothetical protein D8674_003383 [Pyrus ussuriensis x Pyrus communis]|uniref:RNase H type-1 domain-containing protein n=1 Tax=Pyrus ussuriensis x Pyrus communis TaxID=2448454 RepID=A0A5N5FGX5_9ROSA|nr:hypothetical protein D8674_003383 [Pyrus ussuriensis x Pyrus communis]